MLLPRGLWHRYRPKKQQGWTENYIGFSGALAVHYFSRYFKKKTGFNPSELRQKLT
jgi:YesN/AraC family two-component response regulator